MRDENVRTELKTKRKTEPNKRKRKPLHTKMLYSNDRAPCNGRTTDCDPRVNICIKLSPPPAVKFQPITDENTTMARAASLRFIQ